MTQIAKESAENRQIDYSNVSRFNSHTEEIPARTERLIIVIPARSAQPQFRHLDGGAARRVHVRSRKYGNSISTRSMRDEIMD